MDASSAARHPSALGAGEPRSSQTPEQALLCGILERALLDLRLLADSAHPEDRAEIRRIKEWLSSDYCGATYGGFTFLFVCQHLQMAPDDVRRRAFCAEGS